jgi:hypothetical protein
MLQLTSGSDSVQLGIPLTVSYENYRRQTLIPNMIGRLEYLGSFSYLRSPHRRLPFDKYCTTAIFHVND